MADEEEKKDTTFSQADIDAAVLKAKDESDEGLKNKNKELLDSLSKLKKDAKKHEGVDIEALLSLQKTVDNDEILSLLSKGNHKEALEKSNERLTVTHKAEMEGLNTKITELTVSGTKNSALVETLLIDGGAKTAFLQAKGLPAASHDIALRARGVWSVEDGAIVARGDDGEMMQGKAGPLTMSEWAESLKATAAHLFPASEGSPGTGGAGDPGGDGGIEDQMIAASKSGNQTLLRELSKKLRESKRGR